MTREWLSETHGRMFELFRHFVGRFFDSDLVVAREHTPMAVIGAVSVLMQWIFLYVQPVKEKYAHLSGMAAPEPYREALRADELWLITLMMSAVALLTAIRWQSLLPGRQDLHALASLPVRPGQVFAAKFLAFLAVSTAAVGVLNFLPGVVFPALSAGRWAFDQSLRRNALAHTAACVAGSYFVFFGLAALQGVLLNLLPGRALRRVSGILQGVLAAGALSMLVLSFSIDSRIADAAAGPSLGRWLAPVWFLGLRQTMAGDPNPPMHGFARMALAALVAATMLTVAAFAVSYVRRRKLLAEETPAPPKGRRWPGAILDRLVPDPRRQAVLSFVWKTAADSSQHRMILMAYVGFGGAIFLTSMLGAGRVYDPAGAMTARFVGGHVILLVFALLGLRHLFSLPVELGANWLFRITEREGRREWMRVLDHAILFAGAAAMAALPFPLEAKLLGWRAAPEALLSLAFGLLCYECAFSQWEKLPFTCSYLPGKTPTWMIALELLGLLAALPVVTRTMVWSLYRPPAYLALLAAFAAGGWRLRAARLAACEDAPLRYEELPEPEIHGLGLMQ